MCRITSDGGLLAYREWIIPSAWTTIAALRLAEGRRGKNIRQNVASPTWNSPWGEFVRVPDPEWTPMLAGFLAANVCRIVDVTPEQRIRLLIKLVPSAALSSTTLDAVLTRLLLVLNPSDERMIADLEKVV